MKKCVLSGIVALIIHANLYAQEKVSFFEEHIDFELDSAYFSINGIYSFGNPTDKAIHQPIFFPFAEETIAIDSIAVTDLNQLSRIPFRRLNRMIAFLINLPPRDTVDIAIFYRQKAAEKNTYIITSTQAWKQALKQAVYSLTASVPVDETQFSYPFLSKEKRNGCCFYLWEMTDFLPDKEFEVVLCQ